MSDLGNVPNGNTSWATAINDRGQIVGESGYWTGATGDQFGNAFIYTNGQMTDLGSFGGSYCQAFGINIAGQIAGDYYGVPTGGRYYHAFLYSGGQLTDFGTNFSYQSMASGINDAGKVVGSYWTNSTNDGLGAFLYSHETVTCLESFGGRVAEAFGINNSGLVVGYSATSSGGTYACLWDASGTTITMTNMNTLSTSRASYALSINNSGQAVGYFYPALSPAIERAFIYNNGSMMDLNSLITPTPGWTLSRASGINDSGWICGYETDGSGQTRAFLLTPVPEPSAFVLLTVGIIGMLDYAWRRRIHRA
jgi:probable HAF family extracellular repeat protein